MSNLYTSLKTSRRPGLQDDDDIEKVAPAPMKNKAEVQKVSKSIEQKEGENVAHTGDDNSTKQKQQRPTEGRSNRLRRREEQEEQNEQYQSDDDPDEDLMPGAFAVETGRSSNNHLQEDVPVAASTPQMSTVRATAVDEAQLREAIIEEFVGAAAEAIVVDSSEQKSTSDAQQQRNWMLRPKTLAILLFFFLIVTVGLVVVFVVFWPESNGGDENELETPLGISNQSPGPEFVETIEPTTTPVATIAPSPNPTTNPSTSPSERPVIPPISPTPGGSSAAYCNVGGWTNPLEVGECVIGNTAARAPTSWRACGYTVDHSTWYAFNGTGGTVTASTCNNGTDFDTRMSVFQGGCDGVPIFCAATNNDACGEQSSVTFNTEEGTTYYVGIDGENTAKGKFAFRVVEGTTSQTEQCPPPTCRSVSSDSPSRTRVE